MPKAEKRFSEIIEYLTENWSEKEIKFFITQTEHTISKIQLFPRLFKRSSKKKIHEAVITKHNILIYQVKKNRIELLTFFDTRQNPKKKYK